MYIHKCRVNVEEEFMPQYQEDENMFDVYNEHEGGPHQREPIRLPVDEFAMPVDEGGEEKGEREDAQPQRIGKDVFDVCARVHIRICASF